jgi:chromosome segregation ATPase
MVGSDQLLFLAAATAGITLLSSVLVIAVGARKVREQLLELDALKRSVQTVRSDLFDIARTGHRTSAGLQELSGIGLHLRQIRREQTRLSDTLKMISSAMETLARLLQLRDDIKREQGEQIEETAEAARLLQEWRSRVTPVFADARSLFDSEPIRELIDGFTPQATSRNPEFFGDPKEGDPKEGDPKEYAKRDSRANATGN